MTAPARLAALLRGIDVGARNRNKLAQIADAQARSA